MKVVAHSWTLISRSGSYLKAILYLSAMSVMMPLVEQATALSVITLSAASVSAVSKRVLKNSSQELLLTSNRTESFSRLKMKSCKWSAVKPTSGGLKNT